MTDSKSVPSPSKENVGEPEEEPCELWYDDIVHEAHYYENVLRIQGSVVPVRDDEAHCPGWGNHESE